MTLMVIIVIVIVIVIVVLVSVGGSARDAELTLELVHLVASGPREAGEARNPFLSGNLTIPVLIKGTHDVCCFGGVVVSAGFAAHRGGDLFACDESIAVGVHSVEYGEIECANGGVQRAAHCVFCGRGGGGDSGSGSCSSSSSSSSSSRCSGSSSR